MVNPKEDYSITGEDNIQNKATSIKNMSKSYEMRLRGFKWDISENKWIPHTRALVGSEFIDLTVGILTSFSETANLMTTKEQETFLIQFSDAFFKVNNMCLNDMSLRDVHYRSVLKMFKDTLLNIGEIILGSRDILKNVFSEQEHVDHEGGEF